MDGVMCSYIFSFSIVSVRGYECFQICAYKYSTFERIELMRREANAPENMKMSYDELVHQIKL